MEAAGSIAGTVVVERSRGSWVDWIEARIDGLPVPAPIGWLLVTGVLAVVDVGLHWLAGDAPVGSLSLTYLIEVTFPTLFLGSLHALDGVALRSLDRIRPALTADSELAARIGDALTITPAIWANLAVLGGVLLAAGSIVSEPSSYGLRPDSSPVSWAIALAFGAASTVAVLAFIAHAIHQLRLVSAIHRDLVRVELFHLEPLYAFATLTSWTGAALISFTVYGTITISAFVGSAGYVPSLIDLATIVLVVGVAIASFFLPLLGLHQRIVLVKRARLQDANVALDRAIREVEERLEVGRFEQMKDASDALAASTSAVTTVRRISTWPWDAGTLRGFVGALGLPVLIWTITALLGRVLPR